MDASFIIPALNEEAYIVPCLEAIRNQVTDLQYEVIVVDNGSTDRTADLARAHEARVVPCPNRGIAKARNRGATESTGGVLVFVDADTLLPPDYLQTSWSYLKENPKVLGLMGRLELSGDDDYTKIINLLDDSIFRAMKAFKHPRLLGSNTVVRRESFFAVGGYPCVPSEDIALSRKLRKLGHLAYLPDLKVLTSARRLNKDQLNIVLYYAVRDLVTALKGRPNKPGGFQARLLKKLETLSSYKELR
ncbi:MAG TPA: glycosyltransferase [archaeon]|nr:glycosyltransferase [archaeon]